MKALVFGEILYDVYGKNKIIGGAPLNYSLQLSRLIQEKNAVAIMSSVGKDALGNQAIEFALSEDIDISYIQQSEKYSTGIANVFLDEKTKVPDYEIVENVAWDNIEYSEALDRTLSNIDFDVFYCNILALRNEKSYNTFKSIKNKIKAKFKVCDVTFRKNYYTKEKIEDVLNYINVLKVNDDELEVIRQLFYSDINSNEVKSISEKIKSDFDIDYIFLTLGKKGAALLSDSGYFTEASNDIKVVDTVGAGDSFAAALTYGLYKNYDEPKVLRLALFVAEQMIQVSGGTGRYDIEKTIKKALKL